MKLEYRNKKEWIIKQFIKIIQEKEYVIICHDNNLKKYSIEIYRTKIEENNLKIEIISSRTIKGLFNIKFGNYIIIYNENKSDKFIKDIIKEIENDGFKCLYVNIKGIFINFKEIEKLYIYNNKEIKLKLVKFFVEQLLNLEIKLYLRFIKKIYKIWQH